MIELLISHGLGWQVLTLILCLMFRGPLKTLLERTSGLKAPGGFEITASPASAQAIPTPKAPKGEIGSTTTDAAPVIEIAQPSGVSKILNEKREAVQKFGTGNKIVDEDAISITAQLEALQFPLDSKDTNAILVRHLAATQLMVRCERTHRKIFGSQLLALQMMRSAPQPKKALNDILESARNQEPQFYGGSYTFEEWMAFLINEGAATEEEGGQFKITDYGVSYLDYIAVFAPGLRPH